MSLTEYRDVEQRTPEWYEVRRGIVTASVVGQLVTPTLKVANNDTARGITLGLVAERIAGVEENDYMSNDMIRGVLHEPFARDIYSGHYERAVTCGFMRRDEDSWSLGLSPDGLVGFDGLIEVKCPRAKGHLATILSDKVPAAYMAQCQAALLVSDRKWLDFISFRAGLPLFVKRVYPDLDWQAALVAACINFERQAAELVDRYTVATKNLPATERIDLLEVI